MAFTDSNGRTRSALADINITPLVDVVLVLLIIFMLTAPILQSGIEVDVPKTKTVKEITEERLVISIDKQQRVFLGNDPINIHLIDHRILLWHFDAMPTQFSETKTLNPCNTSGPQLRKELPPTFFIHPQSQYFLNLYIRLQP